MKLLLDTTVLIDVIRDRPGRNDSLRSLLERGSALATTTINVGEVFSGLRPNERDVTERLLGALQIYPFTMSVARDAGELRYEFARKGVTLALPDTVVAATALRYGLTLVTDNRKHFPMADIKFFDLT